MVSPVLAALFLRALRFDAADPAWPDADRLVAEPACVEALTALTAACGAARSPVIVPPGPPGLAVGVALGLTLAERLHAARFGRSLVDHRVWCLADHAALRAGPAMEAAALAGAQGAARLAVLAELPPDAFPDLAPYAAFGWTVRRVHTAAEAASALSAAQRGRKPTLIAWPAPAHVLAPAATQITWQQAGQRGAGARRAWLRRLHRHAARDSLLLPARPPPIEFAPDAAASTEATAEAALAALAAAWPELCGHPATGRAAIWTDRPHAAPAAALGLALHGGAAPVLALPPGGLPAALPALAAAAALQAPLVLLGQDAPGLLPPPVALYRPATAAETWACLGLALRGAGPAYMQISALPPAPAGADAAGCLRGAARLTPSGEITLVAGGPDLATAWAARAALAAEGVDAAVLAIPSPTRFAALPEPDRTALLGPGTVLRIGMPDPPRVPTGATAVDIVRQVRAERTAASRFLEKTDELLESPDQLD